MLEIIVLGERFVTRLTFSNMMPCWIYYNYIINNRINNNAINSIMENSYYKLTFCR